MVTPDLRYRFKGHRGDGRSIRLPPAPSPEQISPLTGLIVLSFKKLLISPGQADDSPGRETSPPISLCHSTAEDEPEVIVSLRQPTCSSCPNTIYPPHFSERLFGRRHGDKEGHRFTRKRSGGPGGRGLSFGASVQLPMFDRAEPDAWFILANAHFNLRKVRDPNTKYWYVLSKFDAATIRKLSTFLK